MTAFCGLGEWKGNAEVYDGAGRYLGSGVDQRHVRTPQEDGRLRIDLAFLGPFRLAGHYFIRDAGDYRVYEGPANLGVAEAIAEDLVDADHYWPAIGMSQRFFLMMMPGGQRQLSLALLSRGEGLVYAVVGENQREGTCAPAGALPSVASVDVADDPATGRGAVLVHRPGTWRGALTRRDAELRVVETVDHEETVEVDDTRVLWRLGPVGQDASVVELRTDGFHAWSSAGSVAGSYSLFGGRALAGTLQHVGREVRERRRDVVSLDGEERAVVRQWFRGSKRLGVEHGVLRFEAR